MVLRKHGCLWAGDVMKKLLLAIALLTICSPSWATIYYARNGGSDVADGLADGTAWASASKAMSVVTDGDTIYFARGSTFNEQLIFTGKSNLVMSSYASSVPSGNRPVFDSQGVRRYAGYCAQDCHDITIDGLAFKRAVTTVSYDGDCFRLLGAKDHPTYNVTVRNSLAQGCEVHGFKTGTNDADFGTTAVAYNITFANNQSSDNLWHGIQASNGSGNIVVSGNTVSYNDVAAAHSDSAGVRFGATQVGVIADNNIYGNRRGIILSNSAGDFRGGASDIRVYRNKVYNHGSIGLWIDTSDGNLFYNNLVYNNGSRGLTCTASTDTQFYNNTFFNNLAGVADDGSSATWYFEDACGNNTFKNNINYLSATNNYPVYLKAGTGDVFENNLYYRTAGDPAKLLISSSLWKSWAQWQALGRDAHGVNANPLVVDSTLYNLNLTQPSPAINAAAGMTEFADDYTGTERHGWDIGAYWYPRPHIKGPTLRGVTIQFQ
jgi:parallel beta-helix repeat protein